VARNFVKMDTMVLQWKNRIESRNRLAQKEKEKKEGILAEVPVLVPNALTVSQSYCLI
jgi:hypothetical protein